MMTEAGSSLEDLFVALLIPGDSEVCCVALEQPGVSLHVGELLTPLGAAGIEKAVVKAAILVQLSMVTTNSDL